MNFAETELHHMAQVTSLDDMMKEIVTYLKENDLWSNTLLVVLSDNGASYTNGDNAPLRGSKNTIWEGAVRVPGFVTGGYLPESRQGQALNNTLIHAVDWYPTLLSAANLQVTYVLEDDSTRDEPLDELDGIDLWPTIIGEEDENNLYTREIVLSLDPFDCGLTLCGAIRVGRWKYISTDQDLYELDYISDDSFWLRSYSKSSNDILNCGDTPDVDEDGNQIDSEVFLYTCDTDEGCLFDLVNDPCEYTNVISSYPDVAQYLRSRLIYYNSSQVDPLTTLMSTASAEMIDPDLFDGYWSPFLDDDEVTFETILESDFQTKKKRIYETTAP